MWHRTFWLIGLLTIGGGWAALAWSQSQPGTNPPETKKSVPPRPPFKGAERDLSKLDLTQRNTYLSCQRGADWLQRANRPDGRFVHGFLPALRLPMEGDHFLSQVGAAFALARASRFFADPAAAAIARQALLTLLLETTVDSKSPHLRHTSLPPGAVNRVAAAGWLVAAILELPNPGQDLVNQADQLVNYLRTQLRADGAWNWNEAKETAGTEEGDCIVHLAGPGILALVRSQQQQPADWKLAAVRQAYNHHYQWWRAHKHPALVPWLTTVGVELYALTKETALLASLFEMNDWLCTLQYQTVDPRRPLWMGGFQGWVDGKAMPVPPEASGARLVESLAEACRAARLVGDVPHYQRYRQAGERGLQFLLTLQYTEANTQHFADWYRPVLVGAFHATHQDGNLRLDFTQQAVSAQVQYLRHVAELP